MNLNFDVVTIEATNSNSKRVRKIPINEAAKEVFIQQMEKQKENPSE